MSVDMSKHFSTSALIRFTLPTIAMMIFTSCYTIVDGFFVSNYAGKTALAAVNLILPPVMMLAS
ncbi:MAG: MATE family efflux transporter, partial [Enterorhabdus sp.]|nr:MATE family efflux transporter [Enterorhabdus sp.]